MGRSHSRALALRRASIEGSQQWRSQLKIGLAGSIHHYVAMPDEKYEARIAAKMRIQKAGGGGALVGPGAYADLETRVAARRLLPELMAEFVRSQTEELDKQIANAERAVSAAYDEWQRARQPPDPMKQFAGVVWPHRRRDAQDEYNLHRASLIESLAKGDVLQQPPRWRWWLRRIIRVFTGGTHVA